MAPPYLHTLPCLLILPILLSSLAQSLPDKTTITTIATTTFTTLYHPATPSSSRTLTADPNDQPTTSTRAENLSRAIKAATLLLPPTAHWYNATTGLWQDLWWNSANLVTTLARLGQVVGEETEGAGEGEEAKGWRDSVVGFLEREFEVLGRETGQGQQGGWTRGYYDDGGWWALAWLQVYDLTNDVRYLHTAEGIFEELTTGLNATCGGQWWDKAHTASNTINNALYISVAAHLANRVPTTSPSSQTPETYRAAAQTHLHWLRDQNLLTPNGTYVDGLDLKTCKPTGPVFTYNQGVMIGALVEMSRFPPPAAAAVATSASAEDHEEDGEEEEGASPLLDQAEAIATGTMRSLVDGDGILTETAFAPSFPDLDLVAAQFKGIFVRNLAFLSAVRPREEYREFLSRNARSVWERDRIPGGENGGLLGAAWQGPVGSVSAAAHGSGLDCLVAAAGVGG
ncbi:hypothetical protein KC363_g7232 [Hortaea werneckii]|nr:hypothetical protein KC361_g4520 [Hortaea werneckii]KAI7185258.1 hypothetical protein KC363_g7232 [Hortaea werneckii]KAI7507019.1 hypothetical protein KC347_g7167 [Hortaea werneckii]